MITLKNYLWIMLTYAQMNGLRPNFFMVHFSLSEDLYLELGEFHPREIFNIPVYFIPWSLKEGRNVKLICNDGWKSLEGLPYDNEEPYVCYYYDVQVGELDTVRILEE